MNAIRRIKLLEEKSNPVLPLWEPPMIEVMAGEENNEDHLKRVNSIKEKAIRNGWQQNKGVYMVEVITHGQ